MMRFVSWRGTRSVVVEIRKNTEEPSIVLNPVIEALPRDHQLTDKTTRILCCNLEITTHLPIS